VHSLTGEPYGATTAWFIDFSSKCLEAAERAGVARDLCAYLRNYWGSVILDKFILADGTVVDQWPTSDFLFTTHICCSHAKWYQYASQLEGGIPLYAIDVSVGPYLNKGKLDYLVQQLADSIEWMEKITGRKYDDELLIEAIRNECRSESLWAKICNYNKAIPAPLDEKSMFSLYVFNTLCPQKREIVDFYERVRDEVGERVEKRIAAVATESFRILTDSQPPWPFLQVFRYLEREYGAISLGSLYTFSLTTPWDEEDDTLVPPKTPEEQGIEMRNREEALRAYAAFVLKKLIWRPFYSSHLRSDLLVKMAKQWKADAVFFHLNRGCEAMAIGQMENRLALLEENIPVLTFEGSMGDHRDFDLPRTINRIDSFLEGLGVKKLAKR
jgi:benzoyl-CoA reductase subunit B